MSKTFHYGLTPQSQSRKEIFEIQSSVVLGHKGFYYQFTRDITNMVISELRTYFEINPKTASYRWVGNVVDPAVGDKETSIDCSRIHIAREYGDQIKLLPSVMVRDVSGKIRDLFLGKKMGTLVIENVDYIPAGDMPQYYDVGERVGGKIELSVVLAIKARNPVENDEVTDLTLLGLVGPIGREFHKQNAAWLPEQGSVSGLGVEDETAQSKIFVRTLTFGLQVEWYDDFLYQAVTVEGIESESIYLQVVQ